MGRARLTSLSQQFVSMHNAKTDAALFKQARVDGTEFTNSFEIADAHMVWAEIKLWIVALL